MPIPVVAAPSFTPAMESARSGYAGGGLEFHCCDASIGKADLINLKERFKEREHWEEVDLDFSNTQWTRETMLGLEKLLSRASVGDKISINFQDSELPKEAAQVLAKVVLQHPGEIVLNLKQTHLDPVDIKMLVDGLIARGENKHQGLGSVTLRLEDNALGDAGAVELAQALDRVYYDLRVWLCHNGIRDAGGRALAEGLKNHTGYNQIRLDLWNNPLSHESLKIFRAAKALPGNNVIHPKLFEGFVVGIQTASHDELKLFLEELRRLQQEGQGVLKAIDLRQGYSLSVFEFAEKSAHPGIVLVCQGLEDGIENVTTGSLLMAQGEEGYLVPKLVINSDGGGKGICLHLLRSLANADSGAVTGEEFKPRPMHTWNPKIEKHEEKTFFFSDQALVEAAQRAFQSYKASKEGQHYQKQVQGDLDMAESLGLAGDAVWEEPWKGKIKKAFDERLKAELGTTKSLDMVVTEAKAAACAKVFFERGISFAAVKCPQNSLSVDFLWHWLAQVTKKNKINRNGIAVNQTAC